MRKRTLYSTFATDDNDDDYNWLTANHKRRANASITILQPVIRIPLPKQCQESEGLQSVFIRSLKFGFWFSWNLSSTKLLG